MKFILVNLLLIATGFLAIANDSKNETEPKEEIGRYQVSTTYRENGNWVFVTIIDTKTGEIIKKERYNGFNEYIQK